MSTCEHHGSHNHAHGKPTGSMAFITAITANGLFVICQLIFAYLAHSTSLFADAVHNLGDVFSLVVAWIGNMMLLRLPTDRATYGMKKASILAALANVVVLVFTCGIIATEAVFKFFSPTEINTGFVMIVASIGVLVNAATAVLFWRGSDDLNIRAAFLHLAYDALISLGVVFTAILLAWTGWLWLDPLVGLLIAGVILRGTWSIFTDSVRLIIDGVPKHISVAKVRDLLMGQVGVKGVHDLHIWAMSTQENALSVHLWMPDEQLKDETRHTLSQKLREKHHIHHTTIQVERTQSHCDDACKPYI
ncbi:MAG: cation diffusion facilitator family transporter [Legionellaceae bacterium]|nr:cation diffusion facilitator family transporter [Legionellaceae bacterium]